jgi:hypothetical protein
MNTSVFEWLARWSKNMDDKAMGWVFEEVRTLTVRRGCASSLPLNAEIHNEPVFGFNPQRIRTTVKVTIDLDAGNIDWLTEKGGAYTLYEEDRLLGTEGGWKIKEAWAKEELLTLFLEN